MITTANHFTPKKKRALKAITTHSTEQAINTKRFLIQPLSQFCYLEGMPSWTPNGSSWTLSGSCHLHQYDSTNAGPPLAYLWQSSLPQITWQQKNCHHLGSKTAAEEFTEKMDYNCIDSKEQTEKLCYWVSDFFFLGGVWFFFFWSIVFNPLFWEAFLVYSVVFSSALKGETSSVSSLLSCCNMAAMH